MSGKQHKRELKRQKEAARQAARKAERQRAVFTGVVIGVIVALGAGIVVLTLQQEGRILAAEETPSPTATPTATDTATPTEDARPVACAGTAPSPEPKPTFTEPPADVTEEGVDYRARIETTCGTVVVDLHEDRAPETVNSFVFLAQQGFFDGLEIFRNATSIGALQTGAGTNDAGFDIGYVLPDELEVAETDGYPPGSVAMANAGPGTAGSQFFFVYNESFDEAFADNRAYSVFAQVTEGLDVLEQIGAIAVDGETPQERAFLESVTIETAEGSSPTETATE